MSTARLLISCMLLFALVSVAPAGQAVAFTEEAIARGVSYNIEQPDTFGSGLAFVDLDNDADPDLVVIGRTTTGVGPILGVYENDGAGAFIDRSVAYLQIPQLRMASGVTAADYDADGDLDLYISVWLQPNVLLRNNGNFSFTDVSAPAGLNDAGAGAGCGWGDYDGDGWLDVYVPNRTGTNLPTGEPSMIPNRLFRNLGGTFIDVAAALGVAEGDSRSFQASFFDFDRDADADLYLVNDKGLSSGCQWRSRFWENVGGALVDISLESRTDGCVDGMCIALGDFDRNGLQDIYVTNLPFGNPLYLNNGDGTFTESSLNAGVGSYTTGWGSVFFDYDNDGWLDLYVCNHATANRLYENDGVWPTTDVAAAMGVATGPGESFCVATADIDNDGDLDLAVSDRESRVKLYINHDGAARDWVKFRVVGRGANRFAIGANVVINAGGVSQIREVISGDNFKSQNDLTLHFGLDDAALVDAAHVVWPAGVTRDLANLPSNQTWTLYPPERLGDADGDGAVGLSDFLALAACFGGPLAPGCEMMDFDGDAEIGWDDWPDFLARYTDALDDCDANGTLDLAQILARPARDANHNGVLDRCESVYRDLPPSQP